MAEQEARPIAETEVPCLVLPTRFFRRMVSRSAFWSGTDQTLKRIAISGGAAVTICEAANPYGMSWGTDGIVFGQGARGIMRVSPNGGKPDLLVGVKTNELAHGPQMLQDGQAILFTLSSNSGPDRWDLAKLVRPH